MKVDDDPLVSKLLTSVITFSVVSAPSENHVPGTLLLIVAGINNIGMQNSSYFLRASVSCVRPWKACKKHCKCKQRRHQFGIQILVQCHQ